MTGKPKDFVERSKWRGLQAIINDWGAIIVISALCCYLEHWLFYFFAIWLIGSFQFALSEALLHEASHYNLFPRRSWNDWAEIAVALPFFRTCRQFREEHKSHHVSLGQEDDPLILDYDAHGLFRPNINITWIWFFKPVLGYAGFYYCSVLNLRPWTEGWKIVTFWAAVFPLVVYLGAIKLLLLYWIIPFYWCCMSFLYWSEITDHYRARTGIRSNLSPIKNVLHHNNGYHYVHHRYPAIPWYRLPEAMRTLTPGEGDFCVSFFDTYRALRRDLSKRRCAT